jgi:hypothetical protein
MLVPLPEEYHFTLLRECELWRLNVGFQCTKSVAGIAALLRILAGHAKRRGRIPAVVFDR